MQTYVNPSPWILRMNWLDLLFAHWAVPIEPTRDAVRAAASWRVSGSAAPLQVELDTFDGRAWVGIVPFRMTGVRLRGMPALPGLGAFPEMNVRTYVRVRRAGLWQPAVLFFSLDAASPLAVAVARAWFRLPYFRARMYCETGEAVRYQSVRYGGRATLRAEYEPAGPVFTAAPGTLEHWLTERYALAAVDGARCWVGDVSHAPWPLQPARARLSARGLSPLRLSTVPDHLLFARRLDVVSWSPVQVG